MSTASPVAIWAVTACMMAGLVSAASAQQTAAPPAAQPPPATPAPAATPPAAVTPPAPAATQTPAATPAKSPVDGWAGEVAPSSETDGIVLDAAQTEAVKTVSAYFAELNNLKGEFVQTNADNKRMRGKFFVKRPGRFRFDYALPSRQIIISDGATLAIQDLDLNNEDRVELDQTPFRLLLRKDVDLLRDARIIEVQQAEDQIVLGLQDKSPDTPGRIRLYLSKKPALELKEWVSTDPQGQATRIEVSGLVKADEIDANLFKIQQLGAHRTTPQ